MSQPLISYKNHRFPPQVIAHVVSMAPPISAGAGKSWGLGCEAELCLFEAAVRHGGSNL